MRRKVIAVSLIRSGQSIWAADGRIEGAADLPLSPAGRAMIQDNIALLSAHPPIIYHPGDEAATETARLFAAAVNAKTRSVKELADPHMGLLEGVTIREFEERFPSRFKQWQSDPFTVSPPEGEDISHAADRICKAVAKILRRLRGTETAIVLHDLGFGLLRAWLAERPLNELRSVMANSKPVERYAISAALLDDLESSAAPSSES